MACRAKGKRGLAVRWQWVGLPGQRREHGGQGFCGDGSAEGLQDGLSRQREARSGSEVAARLMCRRGGEGPPEWPVALEGSPEGQRDV